MLGGLFPIHKRAEPGQEDGAACGAIQDEDGIQVGHLSLVRVVRWIVSYWLQPLEALLYTLDQVNRDAALLPGVRLGVIVLDTCDNPLYTAEQSLDLLQGFMYRQVQL